MMSRAAPEDYMMMTSHEMSVNYKAMMSHEMIYKCESRIVREYGFYTFARTYGVQSA